MGKGGAFGSCSRSQLFLIFGNTLAFFIAGGLLGYSIFVFSYMRTLNTSVIIVCMGATTGTMISTAMGAWGSLLKKHGVLKAYFYCVLLLNIILLVTGTLCYIKADEIDGYVDYKFRTVKDAMPNSECEFCSDNGAGDCLTADHISQCKSNMSDTLQDNLRTLGCLSILVAIMMTFGSIAAGRLLTWDRLTGPLLHGGGVVMIAFALFNILFAIDFIIIENDAIEDDAWATYVAAGVGCVIVILSLVGIAGMQTKSPCLLLVYQILGFVSLILLGYLAVQSFAQFSDLTDWTRDNFDKDKNVRDKLNDDCYCNNDDYDFSCGTGTSQIQCNQAYATSYSGYASSYASTATASYSSASSTASSYRYYTCTDGTCTRLTGTTVDALGAQQYCLTTERCVDKVVDSAQAGLAAIGTMSCFFIIYLLVCLLASTNVRAKMVEEQRQAMAEGSQLSSPGTSAEMKSRV